MWSKGFGAEETKAAFARAVELAAKSDDFSERFAAAHGQWTIAILRSELRSAQELAAAFHRQAEEVGRVTEAGVARRGLALISYFLGHFDEARSHCEGALASCDSEHEEEARERYGEYTGPLVTAFLANASWQLGEVERACELMETANRRVAELGHVPSMANPLFTKSYLAILRGNAAAALTAAEARRLLRKSRAWRSSAPGPNCLPVGRGAVSVTQRPGGPAFARIGGPGRTRPEARRALLFRASRAARGGDARRGKGARPHRRGIGSRPANRAALQSRLHVSPPWRNPAETRSRESGSGPGSVPNRCCRCKRARRTQLRPASGACTR